MTPFRLASALSIGVMIATAAPAAAAPKTTVKTKYYTVSARSAPRLVQQLALRGPRLDGHVRALASAKLRLDPKVEFASQHGRCHIRSVNMRVHATVTLPRWRERKRIGGALGASWDRFFAFAKRHEEQHIQIAVKHAERFEHRVARLAPTRSCNKLSRRVDAALRRALNEQGAEQDRFDRVEGPRLDRFMRDNWRD